MESQKEEGTAEGRCLVPDQSVPLIWDDEYYYLVTYDAEDSMIKHYRVDKMLKISAFDEKRKGQEIFKQFNTPRYSKSLFGMNSGEEVNVTLEAANHMV